MLTPEDAFVAAANTCVMMMFIWATERFRLDLQSYDCRAEGTKLIELDRTETFTHLRLWPRIRIRAGAEHAGRGRGPRAPRPPVGPEVQPRGQLREVRDHRRADDRDRGLIPWRCSSS